MKKYIYGTLIVAAVAACAIFFFKPPETADRTASKVLAITFRFPEGYEFTEGAPFALTWQTEDSQGALSTSVENRGFDPLVTPYRLVFTSLPNVKAVVLNARLYYCHKASRMCFQDDFKKRVPLDPKADFAIPLVWEIIPKTETLAHRP